MRGTRERPSGGTLSAHAPVPTRHLSAARGRAPPVLLQRDQRARRSGAPNRFRGSALGRVRPMSCSRVRPTESMARSTSACCGATVHNRSAFRTRHSEHSWLRTHSSTLNGASDGEGHGDTGSRLRAPGPRLGRGRRVSRYSADGHLRLTTSRGGQHRLTIPPHSPLRIGTAAAIRSEIGELRRTRSTPVFPNSPGVGSCQRGRRHRCR
jgi:hypothetical protein